uniref:CCHC-type domain-containing protein n=1 Tax=Arundo donax TaxID=35708 RepID=A0A0A8Z6Q8_ARUDO
MAQEETRLKVMNGNASPPSRPTYVVTGSQETRICYNCGVKGHLSRDCHQPFKSNRGRGRSSDRGALRGGGSRGGRRGNRANLAMTEEGTSAVDNVANFVHSNSGKEDWKKTWDWSSA